MTLLTRSALASIDANQAEQVAAGNLYAGEALDIASPCYIKGSDGKVYMSNGTSANEAAQFIGFVARACASGEPVTLFGHGSRFRYGTSLTPGALYYIAATKGRLDTAATTGDTMSVATAINATDILVTRASPSALTAVADAALTGTKAAVVASGNVVGGIPVVYHILAVAGANGDTDITVTHKIRVTGVKVHPRTSVASAVCTVKSTANAITDAMVAAVAGVTTHEASLAVTYDTIAAGGILRATFSGGATQPDADVYVTGFRVA